MRIPHPCRCVEWLLELGVLGLATTVLIVGIDTMPGLHGDEAWVGVRAYEIFHNGARPWVGMWPYTGPLHAYMVAPVMGWWGYRVSMLRMVGVVCNVLAVGLYWRLVRGLYGVFLAGVATALLISWPGFSIYARVATENFALNPFLAMAALVCLVQAVRSVRYGKLLGRAGGLLLAMGVWNHFIMITLVVALAMAALAQWGIRSLRQPVVQHAAWGLMLGYAVPLAIILFKTYALPSSETFAPLMVSYHSNPCDVAMESWPLLARLLHGDMLYCRHTGYVAWRTLPFYTVLWLGAWLIIGAAVFCRRIKSYAVLGGYGGLWAATVLLIPHQTDRYYLLMLYTTPLFIVCALDHLITWLPAYRWELFTGIACGTLGLSSLNFCRTFRNFYMPYATHQTQASSFYMGHYKETSVHFTDVHALYDRLLRSGLPRYIHTNFFIGWPLRFYDLEHAKLSIVIQNDRSFIPVQDKLGCQKVVWIDYIEPRWSDMKAGLALGYFSHGIRWGPFMVMPMPLVPLLPGPDPGYPWPACRRDW